MIRHCCRCGAKVGVMGLCSISPNHAPHDTPEDLVCACGNTKRLEDTVCHECYFSNLADKDRD